jgi:hypothetical protein
VHEPPKNVEPPALLKRHNAVSPPALFFPPPAPPAAEVTGLPDPPSALPAAVPVVLLDVPDAAVDDAKAGEAICMRIAVVAANIPTIATATIFVVLISKI